MAGLLALGANVFNMAIAGVLAGYLPYLLLRGRKTGIFLGGMFSLLVSASLALVELLRSGVRMPPAVLALSIGSVSGIRDYRRRNHTCGNAGAGADPAWLCAAAAGHPRSGRRWRSSPLRWLWRERVFSLHPNARTESQKLALETGIAAHARTFLTSPLAEYKLQMLVFSVSGKIAGGADRIVSGLSPLSRYQPRSDIGITARTPAGRCLVAPRAHRALEPG